MSQISLFLLKEQKLDMSYVFKLKSKLVDLGPYSLKTPKKPGVMGEITSPKHSTEVSQAHWHR